MNDLPTIRDAADFWIASTTGRERELARFFRDHVDRVIHCDRCKGTGIAKGKPCPKCERRRAEVIETWERIERCSND